MEHTTETDPINPNRHRLIQPNYRRVKKKVRKRLSEALENFNEAFKEFYES